MLYIFYGQDSFSLREEVGRLRASLGLNEDGAASITALDGSRTSPEEVLTACQTLPFLGEQRLVIVEGLLGRFNPPARAAGGTRRQDSPSALARWQPLVEQVGNLPPGSSILLLDREVAAGNPLFVTLRPKAQSVREFRPLSARDVPGWISTRARAMKLEISPGAVRLLADLVGNDLWTLASELEKLATYTAGRAITEADVRELVASVREASIFALIDAVIARRPSVSLKLLRQLLATGTEPLQLLVMLARQYRLVLLAKELMATGLSPSAVAQRLSITSEFQMKKVIEQAGGYTLPALEAAYRRLLDTDVAIKRGLHSGDLALELLVSDLAGGGR